MKTRCCGPRTMLLAEYVLYLTVDSHTTDAQECYTAAVSSLSSLNNNNSNNTDNTYFNLIRLLSNQVIHVVMSSKSKR